MTWCPSPIQKKITRRVVFCDDCGQCDCDCEETCDETTDDNTSPDGNRIDPSSVLRATPNGDGTVDLHLASGYPVTVRMA